MPVCTPPLTDTVPVAPPSVGSREEPSDQLAEHGDGSIGQRGSERNELSDNRSPSAIGIEVGYEPGGDDVALPDDLVPASST
jgi:hypothetical protein